jgi:hypothetical protein
MCLEAVAGHGLLHSRDTTYRPTMEPSTGHIQLLRAKITMSCSVPYIDKSLLRVPVQYYQYLTIWRKPLSNLEKKLYFTQKLHFTIFDEARLLCLLTQEFELK